jgi:hypothetical protein
MKGTERLGWTRQLRDALDGLLGDEAIELLANLAWLG